MLEASLIRLEGNECCLAIRARWVESIRKNTAVLVLDLNLMISDLQQKTHAMLEIP